MSRNNAPFVIALLLAACAASAEAPAVTALDAAGEPLRSAFDAATGKVRAIFLAAPT